jgi:hypothetical protein
MFIKFCQPTIRHPSRCQLAVRSATVSLLNLMKYKYSDDAPLAAKTGGRQLLAVTTEHGSIEILDVNGQQPWESG